MWGRDQRVDGHPPFGDGAIWLILTFVLGIVSPTWVAVSNTSGRVVLRGLGLTGLPPATVRPKLPNLERVGVEAERSTPAPPVECPLIDRYKVFRP